MPEAKFREVVKQLRENVSGIKAIVVIGPDGVVTDHLTLERGFDLDTFGSEYATLLRIARRTCEDTGSGNLSEHISISERMVTVARRFASDSFIILVSTLQDQIGRARYELKRAAHILEQANRPV